MVPARLIHRRLPHLARFQAVSVERFALVCFSIPLSSDTDHRHAIELLHRGEVGMGLSTVEGVLGDGDGPAGVLAGIVIAGTTPAWPRFEGDLAAVVVDANDAPAGAAVEQTRWLQASAVRIAHRQHRHLVTEAIDVIAGATMGTDLFAATIGRREPAPWPGVGHRRSGKGDSTIAEFIDTVADTR